MNAHKRKKKFINAESQLWFILLSLMTAGVSIVIHAALVSWTLGNLATQLPNDGRELHALIPQSVFMSSLLAVGLIIPPVVVIFLTATFRWAGPLYRFRMFLEAVAAGRHPEPCRLREKDKVKDMCELLNTVTEPLRESQAQNDKAEAA